MHEHDCDTCRWYEEIHGEWVCGNPESDSYMCEMSSEDSCQDYEQERN